MRSRLYILLGSSIVSLSLLGGTVRAQDAYPYAFGGLALSGGGYELLAGTTGAGINLENRRFMALAEGALDNAHKRDSGTGYDEFAKAQIVWRGPAGWYFGGGGEWNKLITDLYTKQAWHPTLGGGKDFIRPDFSCRLQAFYVLPGTDHLNAVQGPELTLWLPSPARKTHWLYREQVGIYEFHQTAVPGDPGTGNRSVARFADLMVQYRF